MSFEDDFLQGQRDCEEGIVHAAGHSEAYDRGYGTQYEKEQVEAQMSLSMEAENVYH